MSRRISFVLIMILLAGVPLPAVLMAQDDDAACPALVETALAAIDEACTGLARDTACYGHTRVDASFWDETGDLAFDQPSDQVPLAGLRTITTHPLDLDSETWGLAALHVQADVPDTLPGQAVTFLLMGDTILENAVEPSAEVEPVAATVTTSDGSNANLRSGPSTTNNVVFSAASGSTLELVGVDATGDWYEVALDDGGFAWIADFLVHAEADALDALPVSDSRSPYGPMQSFYFTTGLGQPACQEAPDALLVQSPDDVTVTFAINGLEVSIGSTVIFTTAAVPDSAQTALVAALLEGNLTAPDLGITLDAPGETFAVTLNEAGLVDEDSEVIELEAEDSLDAMQNVCQNASDSGLVEGRSIDCTVEVNTVTAPAVTPTPRPVPTSTPAPAGDSLAGIGADATCTVAAINTVNLRGGPGTTYSQQGQLAAGQTANPSGQVQGADGFRWWQLADGAWLRGDLVDMAGACEAVAVVDSTPEPPAVPVNAGGGGGGGNVRFAINYCIGPSVPVIRAGDRVTFGIGVGRWPTVAETEAALAGHSGSIVIDGTPLSVVYHGIRWHEDPPGEPGYGNHVDAYWTATPGTHTVIGDWGIGPPQVCPFFVE